MTTAAITLEDLVRVAAEFSADETPFFPDWCADRGIDPDDLRVFLETWALDDRQQAEFMDAVPWSRRVYESAGAGLLAGFAIGWLLRDQTEPE